jgi:hypothetical protein
MYSGIRDMRTEGHVRPLVQVCTGGMLILDLVCTLGYAMMDYICRKLSNIKNNPAQIEFHSIEHNYCMIFAPHDSRITSGIDRSSLSKLTQLEAFGLERVDRKCVGWICMHSVAPIIFNDPGLCM